MKHVIITNVKYCRNGVAGDGYFAVTFKARFGKRYQPLLAMAFDCDIDTLNEGGYSRKIGIVDAGGATRGLIDAYRHEDYAKEILSAIADWENKNLLTLKKA